VVLFAALVIPSALAQAGERHAIVIGSNEGEGDDAPLEFAETDAAQMARTLVEVGAVAADHVELLVGRKLRTINDTLDRLAARTRGDDLVLVFFSGHGDRRGVHVRQEVWDWPRIRQRLDHMPAGLVLGFFDACQSGAIITAKGLVRAPPIAIAAEALAPTGRFLITSSGPNELSYESRRLGSSPFALSLRTGLHGAADVNHDGRVTLDELYKFVYDRTLAATVAAPSGPQHPLQSTELRGAGDIALVPARVGVEIVATTGTAGTCYLLDHDEERVLAELASGGPSVRLPPGPYVIKCVAGGQVRSGPIRLERASIKLDGVPLVAQHASYALAKGTRPQLTSAVEIGQGAVIALAGASDYVGSAGYRLRIGDFAAVPQVGWLPRHHAVLTSLMLGTRLPWIHIGEGDVEVGIHMGTWFAGTGSGGSQAIAGPYVKYDWARVGAFGMAGKLDFWGLYPLRDGARPEAAVVLSLGFDYRMGGP
jgi:hypothetical protein